MVASTNPYEQALSYHLGGAFIALQALIAQLPLTDPLKDMLVGTAAMWTADAEAAIPRDVPIYVFSGADDPVGGETLQSVHDLVERYRQMGVESIEMKAGCENGVWRVASTSAEITISNALAMAVAFEPHAGPKLLRQFALVIIHEVCCHLRRNSGMCLYLC